MKIIHHDGERLVLEITSGSIARVWGVFILQGMLWFCFGERSGE
jgi:hypothetical protein